ncbi:hypothetical protein SAMN05443551_1762 [Marivita hallyeonensis]|uniref:Uncharacterized protein n=2 Tax=Marivita hallyeonensis TaxID=996342 RepID=A0A1M5RH91_9RHOB|nr:hypothetical protein SAMN05443551_1762 [Marivita hallyeonensis]
MLSDEAIACTWSPLVVEIMTADSDLHTDDVASRLFDDEDEVGLFPMAYGKQCSFAFGGALDSVFGSPVTKLANGLLAQTVLIAEGCTPESHLLVSDCESGQAVRLRNNEHDSTDLDSGIFPKLIGDLIVPKGALDIHSDRSITELAQDAMSLGIGVDVIEFPASFEVKVGAADRVDPACGCRHFFPDSFGSSGH